MPQINQPELFYFINSFPVIYLDRWPLAMIMGLIFVAAMFVFFMIKHKKIFLQKHAGMIIFAVIAIFWAPLFLVSLYNNFYDLFDNLKIINLKNDHKRILRYCNLDFNQNLGGAYCKLFSFVQYVKKTVPAHSDLAVLSAQEKLYFLYYFLMPDFNFTENLEKARVLIIYYSDQYYYKEGKLFKKPTASPDRMVNNQDEMIGDEYEMIGFLDSTRYIIKKKQ